MQGKITALQAQKRNPQRINIYLDGEFAFGLSRFAAAWLQVGQELSEEKVNELQVVDAQEVAYQRALNFLSYRPRSEAEIRKNLLKHAVPDEVAEEVIERLRQNGLVDDRQFAQTWVENRSEFRPRGRCALAIELRQKGIGGETIDEVLREVDEHELALRAAQQQIRKYNGLERNEFRQKLGAFLARRGFSYGVAAPVFQQIWSELSEEEKP
jgi:regulatory protein